MNHAPSDPTFDEPANSHHNSSNHDSASHSPQGAAAAMSTLSGDSERQRKEIYKKYKIQFLDNLIRQLDVVIYCELSILYYMDCSLFSFLARALNHWFYFTPKPPLVSPIITWNRPHIVMIFALNLLSILLHAISTPPTAGEAVRGYLHGGLLIDFVGQKSPVSRVKLVGYDLLVLALQLVMLGISVEKRRMGAPEGMAMAGGNEESAEETQDHDLEERGVRRGEEGAEGIEMRSLRSMSEGRTGAEEDGERNELLEGNETARDDHPGDDFYSGQHVITNIRIVDTVREQWRQASPAATGSSRDGSIGAAAAAELARRRLRFRIRIGGSDYGS